MPGFTLSNALELEPDQLDAYIFNCRNKMKDLIQTVDISKLNNYWNYVTSFNICLCLLNNKYPWSSSFWLQNLLNLVDANDVPLYLSNFKFYFGK